MNVCSVFHTGGSLRRLLSARTHDNGKFVLKRAFDGGQQGHKSLRTAGRTTLEVNLMGQPSGVYFVVLRDGADTSTRPVLVQH